MAVYIAEHELFNACQVLFGHEVSINRQFLDYLQLAGVKSAYRRKAFETHPDMLAGKGHDNPKQGADLFLAVQKAYENLTTYLDARARGLHIQTTVQVRPPPRPRPAAPARPQGAAAWQSAGPRRQPPPRPETTSFRTGAVCSPFQGAIPARRLLFGHYLYYSGVANWQTIIKALVWQRMARPRLGEIGTRFGWLTSRDILQILQRRDLRKSFGTAAVELGYLSETQLRLMVFQQQRLQKKFGEYFLHNNLLSPRELDSLVNRFRTHNINFREQTPFRHAGHRV